jgi:hypothetical protein
LNLQISQPGIQIRGLELCCQHMPKMSPRCNNGAEDDDPRGQSACHSAIFWGVYACRTGTRHAQNASRNPGQTPKYRSLACRFVVWSLCCQHMPKMSPRCDHEVEDDDPRGQSACHSAIFWGVYACRTGTRHAQNASRNPGQTPKIAAWHADS